MKKKLILAIVVIAVILVALAAVLIIRAVVQGQPPALDSVRDRFESLIEASPEINAIFYGKGLPTYPRVEESTEAYVLVYNETEYQLPYSVFEDSEGREMVRYIYYINTKEYYLEFQYKDDPQSSVCFPAKANGDPDFSQMSPAMVADYEACLADERLAEAKKKTQYVLYDAATLETLTNEQVRQTPYYFVEKTKEDRGDAHYYNEKMGFYYYLIPDYPQLTFTYKSTDAIYYDYCTDDCGYKSTAAIKEAASLVYSSAYLSRLYEMQFDGVATDSVVGYARYRDEEGRLQKFMPGRISANTQEITIPVWEYDYDTMEIVKKESSATNVTIRVNGRENASAAWESVTFSFALENGEWYLDSLPGFPSQEISA